MFVAGVLVPGVTGGPVPSFTHTSDFLEITFTDTSTSVHTITDWLWDFGDGNTSIEPSPTHAYIVSTTYQVSLTITDEHGQSKTVTNSVTTLASALPVASFTFARSANDFSFTDLSTASDTTILGWLWDFGDGNTSTDRHPDHTYLSGTSYTITLTVTDDYGNTGVISQVVSPQYRPNADFTWVRLENSTIQFTNTSTDENADITAYNWQFDDGASSSEMSPTHTYADRNDTYDVQLIVYDSNGLLGVTTIEIETKRSLGVTITSNVTNVLECET